MNDIRGDVLMCVPGGESHPHPYCASVEDVRVFIRESVKAH